ncbi:MAG: PocR ligand-binding domain-containing protein [Thermotaleaceae bacterium]
MPMERFNNNNRKNLISMVQLIEKRRKIIFNNPLEINYTLMELIDMEQLEYVQENFSKATGLAFVLMDNKGGELLKTGFSEFCNDWYKVEDCRKACGFCHTYSRLETVIDGKPHVFRCPAGLVEVAVPIMARQQYLGIILCGQVRCVEKEGIPDLGVFINRKKELENNKNFTQLYTKIPELPYSKILSTAHLIHVVVNQMIEKKLKRIDKEDGNRRAIELILRKRIAMEMEKALLLSEFNSAEESVDPYLLCHILDFIKKAASEEGAERTQEVTELLLEMLHDSMKHKDRPV